MERGAAVVADAGGGGGGDAWDPVQYNRFARQREQPFWDLAALLGAVERPSVVDLGCGDGRLTAQLHRRLGASQTLGVDRSPAMLAEAATHAGPGLTFERGDLGGWAAPDTRDVVFSNASLQWIPDHRTVLSRWAASLRAGGQLAVQVPANADHPSHRVAAEVAATMLVDPPVDPVAAHVLAPDDYCALLDRLGFVDQRVRLEVYAHRLGSTADVVEWVKGTTLTRFREPLGPDRWEEFVDRYRSALLAVLGEQSPYLYPFKRILLWGRLSRSTGG